MSVEALTWAFNYPMKNPGAKLILIAIANYANENGECFPSQSHLEKVTGIKQRTILDHLTFLEAEKLIFIEKRRNSEGHFYSNLYRIHHTQILRMVNPPYAESAYGGFTESGKTYAESDKKGDSPYADSAYGEYADSGKKSGPYAEDACDAKEKRREEKIREEKRREEKRRHSQDTREGNSTFSTKNGEYLSKTKPPSLSKTLESEINIWLDILAPLVGAKNRSTIAYARRWREVVEISVKQNESVLDFIDTVKSEQTRNQKTPHFFTPEGTLKALQTKKLKPTKGGFLH